MSSHWKTIEVTYQKSGRSRRRFLAVSFAQPFGEAPNLRFREAIWYSERTFPPKTAFGLTAAEADNRTTKDHDHA